MDDFVVARNPHPSRLPAPPTPAAVRAWALEHAMAVSAKGRVPAAVLAAYQRAHRE